MKTELNYILESKKAYERDSLSGLDVSTPLYYLKLHNGQREFNSDICLCESEFISLKTMYRVGWSYHTQKVYSLELAPNRITILKEVKTSLKEVWEDKELKENLFSRFSEGITPYSMDDLSLIDDACELIWSLKSANPQFVVMKKNRCILPQDVLSKKANMPFFLSGGTQAMINRDAKYGIIFDSKILYPFDYHYIRLDGFGNAELLKNPIDHKGDYKKLVCEMVNLRDQKSGSKEVLLNSTTKDEYITIDSEGLLTQHTKGGISKPYKTIIQNFMKIKPVQSVDGLWGYIDKDCKEIIACEFKDWNFFNNGYAILEEDEREFVIDESGEIIIKPMYEKIEHYENDLFFVQKEKSWAVFQREKILIDFIDIEKKIADLKEEFSLADEEVINHLRSDFFMDTRVLMGRDKPHYLILKIELQKIKRSLHNKMHELSLDEYMKLFATPKNQRNLQEMGLWGRGVNVKECDILKNYKEILEEPSQGFIGYEHQMGSSCYDMSMELPVIFSKKDGSSVSLGVKFENLELIIED